VRPRKARPLELAQRINAAVVINPVNLVALALLARRRGTLPTSRCSTACWRTIRRSSPRRRIRRRSFPARSSHAQIVSYVERLDVSSNASRIRSAT
jgi:glycerol-3-phosphate O-acyltransferase